MTGPARASGVWLTWLGQAGFVLRDRSSRVAVDPFLSPHPRRRVAAPIDVEALADVDLVLCTHEHADHMDLPTLRTLAASSPSMLFAAPAPVVDQLARAGIPEHRILPAYDGEPLGGAGIDVDVVPSEHGQTMTDAYGFGRVDGGPARFVGYVVELAGVRVYHSGDTTWWDGHDECLRELSIDVALLPINGRDRIRESDGVVGNLDAREAAELAARSGAGLLVPMHWDAITGNLGDPAEVVSAVQQRELPVSVLVPRRGATFSVSP
jgi:L-ascorbate 6-phosphate lactonase